MSLVPNGPAKRLKWVRETYWKKDPYAVSMTYEVARNLFGLETNRALAIYFNGAADAIASDELDKALALYAEIDKNLDNAILPRHEHDFLIPWAARELARLNAAQEKGEVDEIDREASENLLMAKGPAIAMWAKRERLDILKFTLAEAFEAVADAEVELAGGIPQGVIVHTFEDGWTVQELHGDEGVRGDADYADAEDLDDETDDDLPAIRRHAAGLRTLDPLLKAEGKVMQHCVADYADEVLNGDSRIYSIRDPKGRPHVTLEWRPTRSEAAEAWTDLSPARFMSIQPRPGYFAQVMGKQNAKVAEKYRPYAIEFISKRFGSEPIGLLLAGKPPVEIDFKSRGTRLFQNVEMDWMDADLRGADLSRMDLTALILRGVDFRFGNLEGAIGRDAMLSDARFDNTDVRGFDVRGATMTNTTISDAKNVKELIWDTSTAFAMSPNQIADTFGVMWDHTQKEYRDAAWHPSARCYVFADDVESDEPEDDTETEDLDDEDDEEPDGAD